MCSCTLGEREGALSHSEGTDDDVIKSSGLCGALMSSREMRVHYRTPKGGRMMCSCAQRRAQFFVLKKCTLEGNLVV